MSTVGEWTGARTKALREALRIGQLAFATAMEVHVRTVKRWEAGGRIRADYAADLDILLSRLTDAERERWIALLPEGDPVKRRHLLRSAPVAAGLLAVGLDADRAAWLASGAGRPDRTAVDLVRSTLHAAMQLDDMHGSPAAQGLVVAQQQVTEAMLRECGPELRQPVQSLHAEWLGFAGALAWDAGEYSTAARLYHLARDLAHEAEDNDLAAYMLAGLSQLAIWERKPRIAVDHAAAATSWITDTDDRQLAAYVHLRMAEAAAIAGQQRACRDALDLAGQAIEGCTPSTPAASRAYYVGPAFYDSYVGGCLTLIGDAGDAVTASRRAIAALPVAYTRDRAVTLLELERGLIALGEIEEAAAAVGHAARLTEQNRSPRLAAAIRDGRADLAPWEKSSAVRDLDEQLAARSIVRA